MNAKEFLVHNRHQRECIECQHAFVVHLFVVFDDALLAEGEMFGQMAALVVSSKQKDRLWVADFETPEIKHTFNGSISSINIVTKKQVLCSSSVCFWVRFLVLRINTVLYSL